MRCGISLNDKDMARYHRQMLLQEVGTEGQGKIKGSKVIVIGAGALGCPVLQYLAAAGVGTIGIVDNDWVDITNLHRQVLYKTKDIEKPKPLAAKEKLNELNPDIRINAHYIRLNKENAINIMQYYDIIVDCTDNFATRYLISDASVILNKPVVYGAIHRFSGQLTVLNHRKGPTLRCIYPEEPHPLETPSCDEIGVMGSVAGMIGSMQATEVLKIILGLDGILSGKMFLFDSSVNSAHYFSVERNESLCQIKELGDYNNDCQTDIDPSKEISFDRLALLIKNDPALKVIDVRGRKEDDLPGIDTISIPYYEIATKLDLLPAGGPLVFYCHNGIVGSMVINYLNRLLNRDDLLLLVRK